MLLVRESRYASLLEYSELAEKQASISFQSSACVWSRENDGSWGVHFIIKKIKYVAYSSQVSHTG